MQNKVGKGTQALAAVFATKQTLTSLHVGRSLVILIDLGVRLPKKFCGCWNYYITQRHYSLLSTLPQRVISPPERQQQCSHRPTAGGNREGS
jgi:hypothetical protein